MALRMFSEVGAPNRGSLASRPSCAAASSSGRESIPSTSWICRILATPEARDLQHLDQARRNLFPQLFQHARPAGSDQLGDNLEGGRTHSLGGGQGAIVQRLA